MGSRGKYQPAYNGCLTLQDHLFFRIVFIFEVILIFFLVVFIFRVIFIFGVGSQTDQHLAIPELKPTRKFPHTKICTTDQPTDICPYRISIPELKSTRKFPQQTDQLTWGLTEAPCWMGRWSESEGISYQTPILWIKKKNTNEPYPVSSWPKSDCS